MVHAPAVVRALFAVVACVLVMWFALFVALCVLLARTNTPEVRGACAGFWDCMLAATIAPVFVPLLYCALAACSMLSWRHFSAGCALVMAVVCLQASLAAAQSAACVTALRGGGSLPLLLYAGFIKAALFAGVGLPVLLPRAQAAPPPSPPAALF